MKESLWGYLILILGVIVTTVILLVSRVTTHSEENYYLARETMQAALLDSIDYSAYRSTGKIIISKSKFMEIYLRRFAESVTNSQDYQIDFYDIYEEPPKASVRIRTTSGEATVNNDTTSFSVDTLITGILETNFEQYNDGKSITVRYITSNDKKGESVTLVLPETNYENVSDENNAACSGDKCNVFYNGKQISKNLRDLSEINPKLQTSIEEFNNTLYQYCEYSDIKTSTTETVETTDYLTKYVKSDNAKTYSNSSKSGGENIANCTKLQIEKDCDYGPKGNMCKTSTGRYIELSKLTSTACSSSNASSSGISPEELDNLKDLEEIEKEIENNKSVLVLLDSNGVNNLGDPATGFYYRLSDKKLYKKYDLESKKYSEEISKIIMPTKGKNTCVFKYNNEIIIDKEGNVKTDKIDTTQVIFKLNVEC